MDCVLIDTDVILDSFYDRKPFAEFSTQILNLCEQKKLKGFTTPVIISNVYYLLRKTGSHQQILDKLKLLLTIIDVVDMNKNTVLNALNSGFNNLDNALQNFAADEQGEIRVILTRNTKSFSKSTLAVLTPKTYLKGIGTD